jgi:RND family efflux transporter MFP subunit
MTTVSQPRRGLSRPSWPIIVAAVLVIALVATLVARVLATRQADPLQGGTAAAVERGALVLSISATGAIEPRDSSELAFSTNAGRIQSVLAREGEAVAQGAPLVQLDTRQLEAAVRAAEAGLAQAQADIAALREGATPEDLAAAEAQVAAAQGALTQTQGGVTRQDMAAAQAAVAEARERLAVLEAGPKSTSVQSAQAALSQAQATLQGQRDSLSAAKTSAQLTMEQAVQALTQAQSAYATAKGNWERAQETGRDPVQPDNTNTATGAKSPNKLNDAQLQQYYDAFVQAEAAMRAAEVQVQAAQVAFDNARQGEVSGIASAEARVSQAQADFDALLKGADSDVLASARAQLAQAQANLAKLGGAQRQGALDAQRANLEAAEAQVSKLLADPKASDLARAEARVAQAQAQLDQARINLEDATLRAPFAGVVAAVNVAPGEAVSQQSPVTLFDVSRYVVKVTVDEVDVARVQVGQQVDVLIDALGAPPLDGTVRQIAPRAQPGSAVTAYEVTVEVDPAGRAVKPGMTASASIVAARRDNALSVPAEAVSAADGKSVVQVITTDAQGDKRLSQQPVETGLRAGDRIEIVSGLSEGQQVLVK